MVQRLEFVHSFLLDHFLAVSAGKVDQGNKGAPHCRSHMLQTALVIVAKSFQTPRYGGSLTSHSFQPKSLSSKKN